jgi:hypothetical protein
MAKDTDVVAVSEQILKHAQREYLRLVHLNKWLGVSTPGTSSFTAAERICFNCGEKGHLAGTCPQPRNQAAFERRMKAFREQHPGRGGRGPGGGRGRGPGRGGGRGGRGGGTSKFSPPTAEEGNKRIIDGKQMHWTPTANKGQGRWFPCDSKPQANMAGKPTESVKTAPSTGSETSALTTSTCTSLQLLTYVFIITSKATLHISHFYSSALAFGCPVYQPFVPRYGTSPLVSRGSYRWCSYFMFYYNFTLFIGSLLARPVSPRRKANFQQLIYRLDSRVANDLVTRFGNAICVNIIS